MSNIEGLSTLRKSYLLTQLHPGWNVIKKSDYVTVSSKTHLLTEPALFIMNHHCNLFTADKYGSPQLMPHAWELLHIFFKKVEAEHKAAIGMLNMQIYKNDSPNIWNSYVQNLEAHEAQVKWLDNMLIVSVKKGWVIAYDKGTY